MACQKCGSTRVMSFSGKCSDCFGGSIGSKDFDGYVPHDMGIGGGDYVEGKLCLDCGQMQGEWPLPLSEIESPDEDE